MKIKPFLIPAASARMMPLFVALFLLSTNRANAQCDFTWAPLNPCPGETVTFSVTNPQGGHVYTFVFSSPGLPPKQGNTVTTAFPLSTSPQNYTVTLLDSLGNQELCTMQEQIQVKTAPALTIDLAPQAGVSFQNGIFATCNGIPPGGLEIKIRNTTPAGLAGQNVSYLIDWGDGTPVGMYTNATFSSGIPAPHTYTKQGSSPITITVQHQNGCSWDYHYEFYSGSNPSVGLGSPGSTINLCPPAILSFPVTTVSGNSPGTTYSFQVNGVTKQTFTQSNVPATVTYTFTESSCGQGDAASPNTYFVKMIAQNPCGRSEAQVGPITVSEAPVAVIGMTMPPNLCPDAVITFSNQSWGGAAVVQTSPGVFSCDSTTEQVEWIVSPGINGIDFQYDPNTVYDQSITIKFLKTGTYLIKMNVLNQNSTCGVSMATKIVTIAELPLADADAEIVGNGDCAPKTIRFYNKSINATAPLNWKVNQPTGWTFDPSSSSTSQNPTIIFAQAGTYTITLMVSNPCGMDSWDTTITVKSAPAATLALPAAPICAPNTFSITPAMFAVTNNGGFADNELTYNWTIQRPGNPPISSTDKFPQGIVFDQAGTYVFSVTVTNGCGSTTATAALNVGLIPNALFSFAAPADSCVSKTIPFTNNSSGTNLVFQPIGIQGPPGGTVLTNNMPDDFSITFLTAGTYTVTLSASNDCPMPNTDTHTATFVFYDKPIIGAFNVSAPCEGQSVTFLPSNLSLSSGGLPCQCTYNIPGVMNQTLPCDQATPPFALPGSGTYTVTVTATNPCGSATRSTNFTLAQNPVADFDLILPNPPCLPFSVQCTDQSLPFSAAPFREWSILNAAGVVLATTATTNASFPITAIGDYTVRLRLGNGCDTVLLEKQFSAFASPVAQLVVGGTDSCGSGTAALNLVVGSTGGQPVSIAWDFPGGNPSSGLGQQPMPPLYDQAGAYTISATVDNGLCPPLVLSGPFAVTAIPVADVTIAPRPKCLPANGLSIPLSQAPQTGVNYHWVATRQNDGTNPPNPIMLTGQNTATPNLSIHACGIYTYTLMAWNKCDTVTWSLTDTFYSVASAVLPQFPTPFCQQSILNLSGTQYALGCDPSVAVEWSSPQGQVLSTQWHPQDIQFASPNMAQNFTLFLTISGICGDTTMSTSVAVDAPEALILGPAPLALCKNSMPVPLSASPGGGKWYLNGNEVPAGLVVPADLPAAKYWFVYRKGSGTCVSEDSIEVTIYDPPQATAGPDTTVCVELGQVLLHPTLPPGTLGQWTSSNPGMTISGNTATFSTELTSTLTLTATDTATGCSNTTELALSVIPNTPVAVPATFALCNAPGPVSLPLAANNPMLVFSGPGVTPDGKHFDPSLPGTGAVNVLSWNNTNAAGCVASGTITVQVNDLLAPGVLDAGPPAVICQNGGQFVRMGQPLGLSGLVWLDSTGIVLSPTNSLVIDPSMYAQDFFLQTILSYGFGTPNCRQDDTTLLHIVYAAPDAGPDISKCLNDPPFQLLPANQPPPGFSLSWSPSDMVDPANGNQTAVLHFTIPDCMFSDTVAIVVNALPGSAFSLVPPYCEDTPLVFQNNTPPGSSTLQMWYDNDSLFSTAFEPLGYVATPGQHTILLVSSTAADCTDEFEVSIFIESPPVLTATANTMEGCGPLPVIFSYDSQAADTVFFEVRANNVLLGTEPATGSPQTLVLPDDVSDALYQVSLVAHNECSTTRLDFDILVRARAKAGLALSKDTLCSGEILKVLSKSVNSAADTLIYLGQKIPTSITQTVDIMVVNPTEQPMVVPIFLVSTNPCNVDTIRIDLVINPAEYEALAQTQAGADRVCERDSVLLVGHATAGATTYWKNKNGAVLPGDTVWVRAHVGLNEWVFFAEGCGFDTDTVWFTGKPAPVLDLFFVPNACPGQAHLLDASGNGAAIAFVFPPNDTLPGPIVEYRFQTPGPGPFRIIATDPVEGCTTLLDTFVTVRNNPDIATAHTEGCTILDGHLLEISTTTGAGIAVKRDSTYQAGGPKHQNLLQGFYQIRVTDPVYGCRSDTTVYIPAVRPISLKAYPEAPDTILLGESTNLLAVGEYVVSYSWTRPEWLDDPSSEQPVATPTDLGCHLLIVTAMDDRNCVARDTVVVCVTKERINAVFPTAFTPNSDGVNDLLFPRTKHNVGIVKMDFWVHDQWGELVFRAEEGCLPNDPDSGACAWDGTFKGRKAEMANYRAYASFYYLDGSSIAFSRIVRLIR